MAQFLFWLSAALLVYTFAGYAWLARLRACFAPPVKDPPIPANPLHATVILVAHNEAARIQPRIGNLLATTHPADRLRLIVVSDGSTDDTAPLARAAMGEHGTVLEIPERRGKAHGLNAALALADGDCVVFADARQRFEPETIPRLLAPFADPHIGAVSGSLEIEAAATSAGRGLDAYWRGEKALRAAESRWDSCIGCTGAVYAARREWLEPLPPNTILDDVVIPMRIAVRGYRIRHDASARAYDPQPLEPALEWRRKRRTLAGNFQMLFRYPEWLLPWKNRLWLQLLSHKYLRLAGPWLLVVLLESNLALRGSPFYRLALGGQGAFYLLAVLGPLLPRRRWLGLPASFLLLNATAARALFDAWHRRGKSGW